MQTPDHDFAPEPRYTDEELSTAWDEEFMEDAEVLQACMDFHSGVLTRESFADRIEYLSQRAKSRAEENLSEREQSL